jgi:anti-sigma-K factor RskA
LNIEEYISSGVLELYVLGALDKKEADEVELYAAAYPAIQEELNAIQKTMEGYSGLHAVRPSAEFKKNLFAEIEKRASDSASVENTKTISIAPSSNAFKWMIAASVTVALFTSSLSVYFWSKWKNAEGQLISLREENKIFAQNANYILDSSQKIIQEKNNYFTFVTDTATTRVALKGLPISPSSGALVFWNKNSKEVFIDVKSLPVPPPGMQYQLWALDKGVPIDAGVFDLAGAGSLQKLKSIQSAQAFAVTLEKQGGSLTPTLEMIHILGTI